ncbi:MAG: mechanosensitive ion channel [Thermoanaerobaculia bacterium]|nr:mechanosensitive ion channel [Thermoanaerobaculia bacterium]
MNFEDAVNKLLEKIQGWGEELVVLAPNLVAAILALVVAWLAARLARKALRRILGPVLPGQVARLLASVAYIGVIAVGAFVALGIVGLEKTVTSLLAGAGIIGLALGFAFQDIAANFMSGILLAFRRPFTPGELIETNDYFGKVDRVTLRSTRMTTPTGQMVLIPNRLIFENPIVNFTRLGSRRVDLTCGVAYGDDLAKARKLAVAAVEKVAGRDEDREVELYYNEFGDSSINFVVRFWIPFGDSQAAYLAAQSEAIQRIKTAFDEGGITIPFPIRTLDFGVVGGEPLAEHVEKMPGIGGGSGETRGRETAPRE